MIPENLREQWELVQARAEVLFLADRGGGHPDCLLGADLPPTARRVILRRMGFRVSEEYNSRDLPCGGFQAGSMAAGVGRTEKL